MDPFTWLSKSRATSSTHIQQPCEYTGCSPEDLPEAMNDRERWRESVRYDDDDVCVCVEAQII